MISPINDATLKVVVVMSRARTTPAVESSRGEQDRDRRGEGAEFGEQHAEDEQQRQQQNLERSWKDCCCSRYVPPYWTRISAGRCRSPDRLAERGDRGAQVGAFKPRGNRHLAAAGFRGGFRSAAAAVDLRRRTECGSVCRWR